MVVSLLLALLLLVAPAPREDLVIVNATDEAFAYDLYDPRMMRPLHQRVVLDGSAGTVRVLAAGGSAVVGACEAARASQGFQLALYRISERGDRAVARLAEVRQVPPSSLQRSCRIVVTAVGS